MESSCFFELCRNKTTAACYIESLIKEEKVKKYILNDALDYACGTKENIDIVKILIKYGASHFGDGLFVSCRNNNMEISLFLLSLLKNVDEEKYMTAVNYGMYGASLGNKVESVNLMVLNGANKWKHLINNSKKCLEIYKIYVQQTNICDLNYYEYLVRDQDPLYYMVIYQNKCNLKVIPIELLRYLRKFF